MYTWIEIDQERADCVKDDMGKEGFTDEMTPDERK